MNESKKRIQSLGRVRILQPKKDTDSIAKTHKERITFAAEVAMFPGAFWIGTEAHNAATAVGAWGVGADRIGTTP